MIELSKPPKNNGCIHCHKLHFNEKDDIRCLREQNMRLMFQPETKPECPIIVGYDPAYPGVEKTVATPLRKTKDVPMSQILRYFEYAHLPDKLKLVSQPFCLLANSLDRELPESEEKQVALRKLLESKDAAVRAAISV